MKRAIYEWAWMLFGSVAIACLTWWIITLLTSRTNVAFRMAERSFIQVGNGSLYYGTHLDHSRLQPWPWTFFDRSYANVSPAPDDDRQLVGPGMRYRYLSWQGNKTLPPRDAEGIEFSLLIPAGLAASQAAFFYWRYRRVKQQLRLPTP